MWTNWGENDLWASEAINGLILKSIAANIPNGAFEIEELIKSGERAKTLKDFLKIWSQKYPNDVQALIPIVDAHLNFTLEPNGIKDIFANGQDNNESVNKSLPSR